ncbi:DNA (cytosine-5-)-methyltransferase [Geomonas paludis]|uniref:Cytosine-specific methyltransferase n=1 Tax=Geomonas paludis TaxID=2740185 RepID=A0ABY4LBX6_9BACT|nr:DNA (cytosine-5-)-methyltransferase [Geomonas paludis]UPU35264.1 DNA (cytosine-5-)-methyltransferase [Geomonas paludis]
MEHDAVWQVRRTVDALGLETVAGHLGRDTSTIKSWISGASDAPQDALAVLEQLYLDFSSSAITKAGADFTFIDLFAGIGGIRIAFQRAGGTCVFSSEYDSAAQKTYKAYFGESPHFENVFPTVPPGDITKLTPHLKVNKALVPDHDILTGGFPCQPFSLAGVSKKQSMGRKHGFEDPTQGTLFFDVKEILAAKRPKAFLLENVKNLVSHDEKRTFTVISETLRGLGYNIFPRVIDAAGWVPQHRERIYIVGFRIADPDLHPDQTWNVKDFQELYDLAPPVNGPDLLDVLEKDVPEKYTLGPGTWNTLVRHRAHHKSLGQGFGYGLITPPFQGKITRTISARYHKDGAEILISQGEGKRPRRLTPLECSRLMGFPPDFQKLYNRKADSIPPVSDTQAYRQFGNSVAVPVVEAIAKLITGRLRAEGAL